GEGEGPRSLLPVRACSSACATRATRPPGRSSSVGTPRWSPGPARGAEGNRHDSSYQVPGGPWPPRPPAGRHAVPGTHVPLHPPARRRGDRVRRRGAGRGVSAPGPAGGGRTHPPVDHRGEDVAHGGGGPAPPRAARGGRGPARRRRLPAGEI